MSLLAFIFSPTIFNIMGISAHQTLHILIEYLYHLNHKNINSLYIDIIFVNYKMPLEIKKKIFGDMLFTIFKKRYIVLTITFLHLYIHIGLNAF